MSVNLCEKLDEVNWLEARKVLAVTVPKTGKLKSQPMWYAMEFLKNGTKNIGHKRSKTFPGIARAMAEQWG